MMYVTCRGHVVLLKSSMSPTGLCGSREDMRCGMEE